MDAATKTLTLPSGALATLRRGKGRDLMRAQRIVPGNAEPMAVTFALIAELTEINGKPIVYEEVLEMDLQDVLQLLPEALGNFPLPPLPDSPPSSTSDYPQAN